MVYIRSARRGRLIKGVIFGGATVALLVFLIYASWPEFRELLAQKEPDRISVHDAVNLRRIRWVTVEGQWHCDQALAIGRRGRIRRSLIGPIKKTEVPITGDFEGEILVATFKGDAKCAERAGTSLTGVVRSAVIFKSRGTLARWRQGGHRVVVMDVGASPRYALIMLLFLITITGLAIGVFGYHLREMLRSGRRSDRLPAYEPIQ